MSKDKEEARANVLTVQSVYDIMDEIAPFATQESWDNAGLLAGSCRTQVDRILVALDMTCGCIEEAKSLGCQLIITHHPILFHARKNLREDDPEGKTLCALVRSGMAHIAAHTNLDAASGGVSDVLAQQLGLTNIEVLDEGLRMGDFTGTFSDLCTKGRDMLGGVVRPFGDSGRTLSKVAVCGGSGGSLWEIAWKAGCDALFTGEVHHNNALDAVEAGMCVAAGGHFETELPIVHHLKNILQEKLQTMGYTCSVFESTFVPF